MGIAPGSAGIFQQARQRGLHHDGRSFDRLVRESGHPAPGGLTFRRCTGLAMAGLMYLAGRRCGACRRFPFMLDHGAALTASRLLLPPIQANLRARRSPEAEDLPEAEDCLEPKTMASAI